MNPSSIQSQKEWVDMKQFHIAIAVRDPEESIEDYSHRLGQQPATVVVPGKYAMWRTDLLGFSINQTPERAGQLRHLGFDDDDAQDFTCSRDVNGIDWELFSRKTQDDKIVDVYGRAEGK
jgi:catechol 2,3-dioxygenase-like lactoylglutathione lyase family enzyme